MKLWPISLTSRLGGVLLAASVFVGCGVGTSELPETPTFESADLVQTEDQESSAGPTRVSEYQVKPEALCSAVDEIIEYFETDRAIDPQETAPVRTLCQASSLETVTVNESGDIWWDVSVVFDELPADAPEDLVEEFGDQPIVISLTAVADEDR